jgi:putative NIF3 family GTP cyclohydrolase 1 type 2
MICLLILVYAGGHSNTERGYLPLLQQKLIAGLVEEGIQDVDIVVSSKDKDPLMII